MLDSNTHENQRVYDDTPFLLKGTEEVWNFVV